MRIHHLNCGCMCPLGGALFDGYSKGIFAHLPCHCLLLETEAGLVLVDTGFGLRDVANPKARLSSFFIVLNNIHFAEHYTALYQIKQLGFSAGDVRHIVLTHLDFDHAGGLEDFPDATVHVLHTEKQVAERRRGFIGSRRWRPGQWDVVKRWQYYEPAGEEWLGFSAVRALKGLPPDIIMIPLSGHTPGHACIAIAQENGWLLHAGDAYFHHDEIEKPARHCPAGFRFYQWMMEENQAARLSNQARLRRLYAEHSTQLNIFCSQDMQLDRMR